MKTPKQIICEPGNGAPGWLRHFADFIDRRTRDAQVSVPLLEMSKHWAMLPPEAWARAEFRVKRAAVREAMRHTDDVRILVICAGVVGLLDRSIAGETVPEAEWARTRASAANAADYAANAADYVASSYAAETGIINEAICIIADEITACRPQAAG